MSLLRSTQTIISTATAPGVTWWDKAAALSTGAVAYFALVKVCLARRLRKALGAVLSPVD